MQTTIATLNDLIKSPVYYSKGMFVRVPLESGEVILPVVKGPLYYKFTYFKSEYFTINKKQTAAYILINSMTGMMYVGSTKNIYDRIHRHKTDLIKNCNDSKALQESFNLVNKEAFDLCMIYTSNREQAFDIEQFLINQFIDQSVLFNMAANARRPKLGIPVTEENKARLIKLNTGRIKSPEEIEKLRQANLGKILSDQTKEKIRQANSGKIQSPETIAKRVAKITGMQRTPEQNAATSARQIGKIITDETKAKIAESVKRYALENAKPTISINGTQYNNAEHASKFVGLSRKSVTRRLQSNDPQFKDWIYL